MENVQYATYYVPLCNVQLCCTITSTLVYHTLTTPATSLFWTENTGLCWSISKNVTVLNLPIKLHAVNTLMIFIRSYLIILVKIWHFGAGKHIDTSNTDITTMGYYVIIRVR